MTASSKKSEQLLVIITGLSGAGHSTAINALEDLGFYCIDNLPTELVAGAVEYAKKPENGGRNVALGMDVRDRNFAKKFAELKKKIGESMRVEVVFLTAEEEVIANRFNTTRRKHPLLDVSGELMAAIRREKAFMEPVQEVADISYDTTTWSPHQLARTISERYSAGQPARKLHVTITSFGFKYGVPKNADLMYDVRFLPNPYFVPDMKARTGIEADVSAYVFGDESSRTYFTKLKDFHEFLLPQYYNEGKHYLRIAIGCTGGKHRSVAIAERLGKELEAKVGDNFLISISHRDLELGQF